MVDVDRSASESIVGLELAVQQFRRCVLDISWYWSASMRSRRLGIVGSTKVTNLRENFPVRFREAENIGRFQILMCKIGLMQLSQTICSVV
jgi:hypothetical protein